MSTWIQTPSLFSSFPFRSGQGRPPGPKGSPFVGVLSAFAEDPLDFLVRVVEAHGDMVLLPFGPVEQYFISDPALIEEVLLTQHKSFIKDEVTRHLSAALGEGMLVTDGEKWRRSRKLVAPKLKRKQIGAYADAMVRHAERYADALEVDGEGRVRDVHEDMMALTLAIVAETLFGSSVVEEVHTVGGALEGLMDAFVAHERSIMRFVPEWIPTPGRRRAQKGLDELDELLYRIIAQRREGEPGDDLLWLMLTAEDESGARMSDQQLRDESVTMFLAGHETTALSLSYGLLQLSEHAAIERQMVAEIDEVLGGRRPTAADFGRLPFTTAVVKETLRLFPPAWAIGREAVEDVEIGGYTIPKGGQVLISQWVVQRDPRWFKDPEAFVPARWLEEVDRPRFAYFPFGGGPRVCVGNHFAMMEMVLVLAALYQRATFRRTTWGRVKLEPAVTLRPVGKIEMRVSLREDRQGEPA